MALDWVQQFYKDNNIGGPGGDLDNAAREYWLAEGRRVGVQAAKDIIERTARDYGNWNWEMYPGIRFDTDSGSIKYQKHLENLNELHDDTRQEEGNTSEARVYRCRIEPAGNEKCEWVTETRPDPEMDEINKNLNKAARKLNKKNRELNIRNKKRNKAYENTTAVASRTPKGEYVIRRGLLRTHNTNNDVDSDAKNNIEAAFKSWYKDQKLEVYDDSILETKGKPPYGEFDPVYYANNNTGVKDAWTEALADDDVDIIDRYKNNENIYYKQHYANVGKAQRLRGNREEANEAATQYREFALTDDDEAAIRSLHLNIDTDNQTDRLLNVPEIAQLWEDAKGGDPYWDELGKKHYLDVYNKHDFAALFRLSDNDEHKKIAFNYQANTGYGITELEDALNEAAGEKGMVEARKFGALTQNVLKDTIEEMKQAKGREEFLSTISGFSGFGEIMDVNTSLTNSILGDSGVGGIVSWLGGGKAEENLEESLEKVTGINRNSAVYNWQKWFDEQLVEKYGKDRIDYLPLDRQTKIIDAWESKATNKENPYNAETGKFTDQFLNRINFESTEKLEEFLNAQPIGSRILTLLKEKWVEDDGERMRVTDKPYGSSMGNFKSTIDNKLQELKNQGLGQDLSLTIDGQEEPIEIEAQYARNFVNEYLSDRFDQSKSMDEFVEYLDVRQEETNPFQTESLLDAIKMNATMQADSYMTQLRAKADAEFDANYYWDPASYEGSNISLTEDYAEQKRVIEQDWQAAKNGDSYWASQAYRFGAVPFNDTNITESQRKQDFARIHYAVKGQSYRNAAGELKPFDGADDIVNPTKIKNYIYENILPELEDEALTQGSVFGQFITPEEFADDVLEGLDPTDKSEWDAVLKQYGLENFQGSFDELKDFILETLRTGSAQKIREQIKFLNEKRKKPTQKVLGVSYIEREEDYKDEKATPDTELYKTFQDAGFQGTEDEFYNDFFPDLDRGEQKLLQKGGENDPLKTFGLDLDDPFASLGTITQFLDDDPTDTDDDDDRSKDEKENYFTYDLKKSDTNWSYKPRKKEDQVLGEYTGWFKGL